MSANTDIICNRIGKGITNRKVDESLEKRSTCGGYPSSRGDG